MLSYKTVEPHTLELLKRIMQIELLEGVRLVGGTSLAFQYGHRTSIDLDFFGAVPDDNNAIRAALQSVGDLKIFKETSSIKIYSIDNIKVDIIDYPYPWLEPVIEEDGLRLANPADIAAMKINAIIGRGSRKDFVDLFYLLKHYSIEEIFDFYKNKYHNYSYFLAVKSLTFFDDAELQPMPHLFENDTWTDIKNHISTIVKKMIL